MHEINAKVTEVEVHALYAVCDHDGGGVTLQVPLRAPSPPQLPPAKRGMELLHSPACALAFSLAPLTLHLTHSLSLELTHHDRFPHFPHFVTLV